MNEGFKPVVYWAYKTPRVKQGVLLPAVPPKPTHNEEDGRKLYPDCIGCWWGGEPHPSQRYHMEKGGCLFEERFDERGKLKEL